MADDRSWSDTFKMYSKGWKCLSGAKDSKAWQACLQLPDDATEKQRADCQRSLQAIYQNCMEAYDAYKGSGNKDLQPPPKPPKS